MLNTREQIKIKTAHDLAYSWQSPQISINPQSSKQNLEKNIIRYSNDYKREKHSAGLSWESRFNNFFKESSLSSYLCNSGMGALLTTFIHIKKNKLNSNKKIIVLGPIYYETLLLLQKLYDDCIEYISLSDPDLVEKILEIDSDFIICEPIYNTLNVESLDIEKILDLVSRNSPVKKTFVIDSTCKPLLYFNDLNLFDNLAIYFVESLAKYWQLGLDLITGGYIACIGDHEEYDDLHTTRSHCGTNVSEFSAGLLPDINLDEFKKRLATAENNAKIIFKTLSQDLNNVSNKINLSYPLSSKKFTGTLLTISFTNDFLNSSLLEELLNSISNYKLNKASLVHGASFGFDLTRYYVTSVNSVYKKNYLRVAAGIENENTIREITRCLSDCISRALKI